MSYSKLLLAMITLCSISITSSSDVSSNPHLNVDDNLNLVSPDESSLLCGIDWQWVDPLPQGNTLNGVAYDGNIYVAVGEYGTILVSDDGIDWKINSSPTPYVLHDIIWAQGEFIAVGGNGTIITSTDGMTWMIQKSGVTATLRSIVWNGSIFMVVGGDRSYPPEVTPSMIITSTDGIMWTEQLSGSVEPLYDLIWADNKFIAVGGDFLFSPYGALVLTSVDGITWSNKRIEVDHDLHGIAWDGSKYIVVGGIPSGSSVILNSVDGVNWHSTDFTSYGLLTDVKSVEEGFIAIGSNGIIAQSNDGTNWTQQTTQSKNTLQKLIVANSKYLTVGGNGSIISSDDATNWVDHSQRQDLKLHKTLWIGNQYLGVGANGLIATSPDGINWTRQISGTDVSFSDVAWDGHSIIVVGGVILKSLDALNWTLVKNMDSAPMIIHYGLNQYISISNYSSHSNICRSADGNEWICQSYPFGIYGLTNDNANYLAIGHKPDNVFYGCCYYVFISPDAINWVEQKIDAHDNYILSSIIRTDREFVVTGDGIFTSRYGLDWSKQDAGFEKNIDNITWNEAQYLATYQDYNFPQGYALTSLDARMWYATPNHGLPVNYYSSLDWGNDEFIYTGYNNDFYSGISNDRILKSPCNPNMAPPSIITNNAFNITDSQVVLHGSVDDRGTKTLVNFEYGLTDFFSNKVRAQPARINPNSGLTDVQINLSSLTCDTTYYYRVTAANDAGTVFGETRTFTTDACKDSIFRLEIYPTDLTIGKVTGDLGGIDCGISCIADLPKGSIINLNASANNGYRFDSWDGACTGAFPSCQLEMGNNKVVKANFTPDSYNIYTSSNPNEAGIVDCIPNPVRHSDNSACYATAHDGYGLSRWEGDCSDLNVSECILSNVKAIKSITAHFGQLFATIEVNRPLSNIESKSSRTMQYASFLVPENATNLTISTTGGSGDVDLYVRYGILPTLDSYDCSPYLSGNIETCSFQNPNTGNWYVGLFAFDPYEGVTLTVSYDLPDQCPYPDSLKISNQTIDQNSFFGACNTIEAGPELTVAAGTVVTFEAGEQIKYFPGFKVQKNASFRAHINQTLKP